MSSSERGTTLGYLPAAGGLDLPFTDTQPPQLALSKKALRKTNSI